MFTSRLWMELGLSCVFAVLLGVLLVRDLFGLVVVGAAAVTYLFTCFVVLTLLSFLPRPTLLNPAGQIGAFAVALAASGLTATVAGAALSPLLGLPGDFDFSLSYYLFMLPFFGLSTLAVALVHITQRIYRRHLHGRVGIWDIVSQR